MKTRKVCQKGVFDLLKNSLPKNLKGELFHFICLTSACTRERFLFYMQHPAISDAKECCSLIVYAYDTSKIKLIDSPNEIFKMTRNNYANIMTAIHQNRRQKIMSTRLKALKCYKPSRSMMPVSHFVNFSRAAVEHANDPDVIIADSNPNPPARGNEWMTYEEVDVELTNG